MPTLVFEPLGQSIDVDPDTKILVAARRAKIDIRFGCAACRCGTCGVKLNLSGGTVTPMAATERELLATLGLSLDGSERLACQTRVLSGEVRVDLAFQDSYSP